FGNRTEIEKRHLHFFGNIASTVRDVPTALGTPWIYPWGAVRNLICMNESPFYLKSDSVFLQTIVSER
ncbi:MAG: hypothetical protein WAX75_02255, partial [Trichococcus flocculiformis]